MNFFKLFFLIVLIFSFNNNADGHGPSRQKVDEKTELLVALSVLEDKNKYKIINIKQ